MRVEKRWGTTDPWSDEYLRDVERAHRLLRGTGRSFMAVVAIMFIVVIVAPGVFLLRVSMESNELSCQVARLGIEHRQQAGPVAELPGPDDVKVGDRYQPDYGCVPGDSTVVYHYRWFLLQRSTVIPYNPAADPDPYDPSD